MAAPKASEPEDYTSTAVQFMGGDDPSVPVDVPGALNALWNHETQRILDLHIPPEQADFKTITDLPIARIKRIMKSDEDVRMISAEAPVLFAKAAELFVLDLTIRSWSHAAEDRLTKKRVLTREAVMEAIQKTDVFDFLVGILCPGQRPQYLIDAEIAARSAPAPAPAPADAPAGNAAYAGLIAGLAAAATKAGESEGITKAAPES